MGEAKQRQLIEGVTRQLMDEGKLVEAGWMSLRLVALQDNVDQAYLDTARQIFFAGAQHVFGSLVTMMDPGEEPTEADLRRMDNMHKELDAFVKDFALRHGIVRGRG